jgi:two-component system OmpR family sensor kinase
MGGLVEDLLLLARLDQQRPLEREPVDLLALAADVVRDAQVTAPDRAVLLEAASTTPPVVLGDEARLRQVLHNLIANGLTHTPAGTPVSIEIGTTQGPAPQVVVEIADRGPGVPPEDEERIFERFYRAEQSRTRSTGGAGLGLSIVAGLVKAHGGTVRVRPREGGGAVFVVELPLAADRASPAVT